MAVLIYQSTKDQRKPGETLTFVEREPPARTSNPFTNPEPTFDVGEVM